MNPEIERDISSISTGGNCVDILLEGEEDTTIGPLPPNFPRFWPPDVPLPKPQPPQETDQS